MASLNPNDRVPLCLFNYEDGRRCRTPRTANHPHFCFYHAQKEARAEAAEKISKDLAYFLAGDYLSANDLSTALSRLIPAVLRGDIKPRIARTVAFMLQTLSQTIRLAQHEYVTALGTNNWRQAIATGVAANSKYRHPAATRQPHTDQPSAHRAERSDGLQPITAAHTSQSPQPASPVAARFIAPFAATPPQPQQSSSAVRAQHAAPQAPPQPPTPTRPSSANEPTLSSAVRASTANSNGANARTAARNSTPPNHFPIA